MQIQNLTLNYKNKIVIDNVSAQIKAWEFIFVIWDSGSWKTSFINSLIGNFKPNSWKIILDDWSDLYWSHNWDFIPAYRRNIWIIFQDYKLMESKTVYENVAFAMEVCNYKTKDILRKVPDVLNQVWLLIKKDKRIDELSGWEKQRVAIARALAHNPDLIIWDEPTGNLDPKTGMSIMQIFDELNREWKTIIIATHDREIVNKFQKRVIAFKDKKISSDVVWWNYCL